jgi:hypothetical protein
MHLTVRYAGLLDVSHPNPVDSIHPNSYIEYLHRTARYYLERETYWSRILEYTAKTDFNPYVSILKSCVLSMERPTEHSDRNLSSTLDKDLIISSMIYAYHVDKQALFS